MLIGERQIIGYRLSTKAAGKRALAPTFSLQAPSNQTAGWFLSLPASAVNKSLIKTKQSSQLSSQSGVQQRAGERCLSNVLHKFRSGTGLRGTTLHACHVPSKLRTIRSSVFTQRALPFLCIQSKRERTCERERKKKCKRQAWLHMPGALQHSLSLSPSLAAVGIITSPVTAELWPGAPRLPNAIAATLGKASDTTEQE